MTLEILLEIILLGIGLSMDAFSVALVSGLKYKDINAKKSIFIALVFGIMQALMPLTGFFIVELAEIIAGSAAGETAGEVASIVVTWAAFVLLMFVGIKMLVESIKELKEVKEVKKDKLFSVKEVIIFGFMTSIDALAAGVACHAGLSNTTTIWIHVSIILVTTFAFSLVGLFLGKQIIKLLKGKVEISGIIGGIILILLAIWVIVSHLTGL